MTADNPEQPKEQAVITVSPLMQIVSDRLGDLVLEHHNFRGEDRIHVSRGEILRVARILRDDPALAFNMLMDATAVDYLGQPDDFETQREVWDRHMSRMRRQPQRRHELVLPPPGPHERFALVYHLNSLTLRHRLRIKCRVPEDDPTIDSLTPIWPGANWLEREAYDLYGIRFNGHPDLRRIYLYDEFVGHPLRKDYHKQAEQPIEPYAGPGAKEPRRPH